MLRMLFIEVTSTDLDNRSRSTVLIGVFTRVSLRFYLASLTVERKLFSMPTEPRSTIDVDIDPNLSCPFNGLSE